jgi:hypothetical protein
MPYPSKLILRECEYDYLEPLGTCNKGTKFFALLCYVLFFEVPTLTSVGEFTISIKIFL